MSTLPSQTSQTQRRWLYQLLAVGLGTNAQIYIHDQRQIVSTPLASPATVTLDRDLLCYLFADAAGSAPHHIPAVLPQKRLQAPNCSKRKSAYLDEGGALAVVARRADLGAGEAEKLWAIWEQTILKTAASHGQATTALARLAAQAKRRGWSWPEPWVAARLAELPTFEAEVAAGELWPAAARLGRASDAMAYSRFVVPPQDRGDLQQPEEYLNGCGRTWLHELIVCPAVAEEVAIKLVEDLVEQGANVRGLAIYDAESHQLLDAHWPVSPAVVAARRGKPLPGRLLAVRERERSSRFLSEDAVTLRAMIDCIAGALLVVPTLPAATCCGRTIEAVLECSRFSMAWIGE